MSVKRIFNNFQYICGTAFDDITLNEKYHLGNIAYQGKLNLCINRGLFRTQLNTYDRTSFRKQLTNKSRSLFFAKKLQRRCSIGFGIRFWIPYQSSKMFLKFDTTGEGQGSFYHQTLNSIHNVNLVKRNIDKKWGNENKSHQISQIKKKYIFV